MNLIFLTILGLLTLFAVSAVLLPLKSRWYFKLIISLFCTVSLVITYWYWGNFSQWYRYNQQLQIKKQASRLLKNYSNPRQLIEALKQKLDDSAKSAQGWYLLGRLYIQQNQLQNAKEAFSKALKHQPDNEQYLVNYAYVVFNSNGQKFSGDILKIYRELLTKNPVQADALSMLALYSFKNHHYEESIEYWQRLLKLVPNNSDEAQYLRKAIIEAEKKLKNKY